MINLHDYEIEDVILEVSYRTDDGLIDLSRTDHCKLLSEVLVENGLDRSFVNEMVSEIQSIAKKRLEEASKAAEEAHKKNLESLGFGNWKKKGDPNNKVVAVTDKKTDRLVMLSPKKSAELTKKHKERVDSKTTKDTKVNPTKAEPQQQPQQKQVDKQKKVGSYSGKNKTLKPIDTTKQQAFTQQPISDEEFNKKNAPYYADEPPPHLSGLGGMVKNPLFPPKYLSVLERLANTKPTGLAKKITHYLPNAGAGMVDSQAGELMTLILTTLPDDEAQNVYQTLLNHSVEMEKNKKNSIVKSSWVKAAMNNRNAILQRIRKKYPNGKMGAGAWDTQEEVEALGLDDYKKNKGFSTDVYFKVFDEQGNPVLHEVSLKKDLRVNMLNKGGMSMLKWDPSIPDDINQRVYGERQNERVLAGGKMFHSKLKKLSSMPPKTKEMKEFLSTLKSKGISIDDAISIMQKKPSKDVRKVILRGMEALASVGDKSAEKWVNMHRGYEDKFRKNSIKAIETNPKLKAGMLNSISEEMPLKSIMSGEEDMVAGDVSLDNETAAEIFGTNDFNKIKENLVVVSPQGKDPYLAYVAGRKENPLPVASLRIREDGVGYRGGFKFQLNMMPKFAKRLKQAHETIYGKVV